MPCFKIFFLSFFLCNGLSSFAWEVKDFKKPSQEQLKKQLSDLQYEVTQEEGTETPFKNEYWDNKAEGIYVDRISGEPLFSSKDKYKSGTGWPSFTRPLENKNIITKEDRGLFTTRTEVRSKYADSHLGHVFDDGPPPTGKRYCMNSAALLFIPKSQLKEKGYAKYLPLFENSSETAVFAGGCFWCMQPPFDKLSGKGVLSTQVGYSGGHTKDPTYQEVSEGGTGHIESIKITYDPKKVSYEELLAIFWHNIDPYDDAGQFCDKGDQYKSAVFFSSEDQKTAYEKFLEELKKSGKLKGKVATQLLPLKEFYPAEDYHQSYYQKNPVRYKFYRFNCGRDTRLKELR